MNKNNIIQFVWGIALTLVGLIMLIRIPARMAEIELQFSSGISFLRFSLYLISILLMGGGAKKIHSTYVQFEKDKKQQKELY
jgi:choline-glycine betaine transporter